MSFVSIVIGFALGLLFLAMGGLSLFAGQWIGAILILISLLLLPPVRFLVYRRSGRRMSAVMRAFLVATLLALFVILIELFADSVEAELEAAALVPDARPWQQGAAQRAAAARKSNATDSAPSAF